MRLLPEVLALWSFGIPLKCKRVLVRLYVIHPLPTPAYWDALRQGVDNNH
jgi:hypothetical protein